MNLDRNRRMVGIRRMAAGLAPVALDVVFVVMLVGMGGCRSVPRRAEGHAPDVTVGQAESLVQAELPEAIRIPPGTRLVEHLHAIGAQIYACASPSAGSAAWTLKAPDARLFDANKQPSGTHGAGPVWTAADGSSVRGKKVAQASSPRGDAIPWLLLKATATEGAGVFSKVTYVQRVNTTGGKAPETGCDASRSGAESRVDYEADYFFYSSE